MEHVWEGDSAISLFSHPLHFESCQVDFRQVRRKVGRSREAPEVITAEVVLTLDCAAESPGVS